MKSKVRVVVYEADIEEETYPSALIRWPVMTCLSASLSFMEDQSLLFSGASNNLLWTVDQVAEWLLDTNNALLHVEEEERGRKVRLKTENKQKRKISDQDLELKERMNQQRERRTKNWQVAKRGDNSRLKRRKLKGDCNLRCVNVWWQRSQLLLLMRVYLAELQLASASGQSLQPDKTMFVCVYFIIQSHICCIVCECQRLAVPCICVYFRGKIVKRPATPPPTLFHSIQFHQC